MRYHKKAKKHMDKTNDLNIKHQVEWRECYVSINKVVHRLYCKTTEDDMFELYLNDKCIVSEQYWLIKLKGFDYEVEIEGETIHCVFDEEKLDVAVKGKYLKRPENYVPLKAVYIICIALCVLTPIIFIMAVVGSLDVAVLALSVGIIGSVGVYYKKALKKTN